MYRNVITLFNHSGDTWYATEIPGVYLSLDKSEIQSRLGDQSSDNALLHIRYKRVNGVPTIAGKTFRFPKDWGLNDNKEKSITFQSGGEFDFFMVGKWTGNKIIKESEYDYGFYDFMNETYDNVYAITSVGGPYNLLPHFVISGR